MPDAVALAKLYIEIGDVQSADSVVDKVKNSCPSESLFGTFMNIFLAELYLAKGDYEKVENCILEIDKVKELGYGMLNNMKDKILAQLYEKKNDYKNALEHYHLSIHEAPG